MKKNFWNNKKVFITGHTGFKGSWLTLWLKKLGADVSGYSLKPKKKVFLLMLTFLMVSNQIMKIFLILGNFLIK
tara:strand:- start:1036 stop:1257 length:222 start_codon:yes stop_codon:yes gene_type:complete